jgi:uncharacterized protein (DUF1330 family)
MPAYALAHLHDPKINDDVLEYLERIDATLAPFAGRFIVHGGDVDVLEGAWPGTIVIIEFPSVANADAWYRSAAYREIIALRTDNIASDTIIVDGVEADHDSAQMAGELRLALQT